MNTELLNLLHLLRKLPQEITNHIMEYDGRWNIRIGIPIMKISTDDERYEILSRIPRIRDNQIFQYESQFGCKTIVWFSSGAQLMYCNDERKNTTTTGPNHSYVFRMRRMRQHSTDHKWKIPVTTKIL